MPVDKDGNVADIITGPDSVPGRTNLGRVHEPYFSAAARDIRKTMLELMGYGRHFDGKVTPEELMELPAAQYAAGEREMLDLYAITSPESKHEYENVLTEYERYEWMADIINDKMHLFMRIKSDTDRFKPENLVDMALKIEKRFELIYDRVSYVGHSGKRRMTRSKVRIAPCAFMLLDKIADSWMAASTSKQNNFGIITARVRADKYARPWRTTPPRVVGVTEGRLYNAYGGERLIAELIDRSGNVATQREVARNITTSENPFNPEKLVSREKIPYGNTRPLQMINSFLYCMGVKVKYVPEKNVTPEDRRSVFADFHNPLKENK